MSDTEIVECPCDNCECGELTEGGDLCLTCKHGACVPEE